MERAPASRMPRLASAIAWIGAAAWLAAVAGGFAFLLRYKNTPGQAGGAAPELWPAGSAIARTAGRATLLLFAHPRCVCTRASLAELNKMMASFQGRLDAKVLFWMPRDAPADWSSGDLWTSAAHIPGVAVTRDEDGREASRFGVATSGGVVLYDGSGRLLFQGGITQSRGHEGDSFGEERIVSLLTTGAADRADAPVFGCALNQEPPVRVARAGATSTQKEGEK